MKKGNGVKNWSLSALQCYESCPAKYKAERIDKVGKKMSSPAMERGISIHAKGEGFLRGDIPNVPKEYEGFKTEMRNLKKAGAIPEEKIAFTKDWQLTDFFSRQAWLRMVVDVQLESHDGGMFAIDFKTGRVYADKHDDQAHLYSTGYLSLGYPRVDIEFWYLDQNDIRTYSHNDSCADDYRTYWEKRIEPLFTDTDWKATPSKFGCRYCAINASCKYAEV